MGVKPLSDLDALLNALTTSHRQQGKSEEDVSVQLQQLVGGFWSAPALYAVVKLGIADLLHAGLQRSDELALATGTHAPSLYRLLRALVSVGLFTEATKDTFALTALSHKLRSDIPDSLYSLILAELGETHDHTWGSLVRSLQTGHPRRDSAASSVPERRPSGQTDACFKQGLGSVAARIQAAVLESYDFSSAGTLVDVGGGDGTFLAFLLQAYTELRGVLVEQPQAIEHARHRLEEEGVSHRCKVVAGDFFEFLPRQGDLYLLKQVLSQYEDEPALQILSTCRRAMWPSGKLLLIETALPTGNEPSLPKHQPEDRSTSTHRQDRTLDEFHMLLPQAGLRITRALTAYPEAILIEAV